jgi:protein-L-isoaspartate(D-aspartate) O-methyltransferase
MVTAKNQAGRDPDGEPMKKLEDLVSELQREGVLKTPRIVQAFQAIDRAAFVPKHFQRQAYDNIPLPIGYGQTISQPYTVALMLEFLQPKEREHALDIGAGSGWVTALLATLVGSRGSVVGVERIPPLADRAQSTLLKFRFPQATVVRGDASRGWALTAPYDLIHVAAAAPAIPLELRQQLAAGGRIIIPVGEPIQDLALITKTGDNSFTEQRLSGFQFVPLISSTT